MCKLLLQHGAKVDAINSVKRTASAMGAFVGNHECVAIINNFVPKEDVYYYTRKQPFEEKAKLPMKMAKPLHELVMTVRSFIFCTLTIFLRFSFSDEYTSSENSFGAEKVSGRAFKQFINFV